MSKIIEINVWNENLKKRTNFDTPKILESVRSDQFSSFKAKILKKICRENNIERKVCPVGDYRCCGLLEKKHKRYKVDWE